MKSSRWGFNHSLYDFDREGIDSEKSDDDIWSIFSEADIF